VYGNALGYFGGITWVILVARVCQMYPNAAPSVVVKRFFSVFGKWKWPAPVHLCPAEDMGLGFHVWNPAVDPRESYHLMPIITPVYPAQNTTHNTTESHKRVLLLGASPLGTDPPAVLTAPAHGQSLSGARR
jgi:poly(A) polymerase